MARVMILAGGTGGHVFPALAVAEWLRGHGHEVVWMGGARGLEQQVVHAAGFPLDAITVGGLRGKGVGRLVTAPAMLLRALWQAGRVLRRRRPQVVLGMGGYAAGPGGVMARLQGIPLVIHEQNRVPGTTNRWLAPWAKRVLEGFPGTFADSLKPCWTGNPLRCEIAALGPKPDHDGPPRLLVVGGSLGAQILNEVVPQALAQMGSPLQVWHQCGRGNAAAVEAAYRRAGVAARVSEFIDNMAAAWRWADLAVCRAGAMTVSELAAAGVAGVLVPYPHAIDDHQARNAEYLVQRGAARLLPQDRLTPARLAQTLAELAAAPQRLREMGAAARRAARLDATETVARICLGEIDGTQNPSA
ncbi:UDP-N-acetylglucosamine--N-acetylmuramyl-(pentapeptide) pyrophosphoryl-undecaprenol N-acetylglucosamine transferase [Methylomarinovum caldicuralii]|uniref:UDP-N-acetylglucosamine--N-acetylmuramyl-(pentapeptide) pyrophosphoryl-undecaprenol N-acetylglucosamine transferase n=1 Tax=Methylomarinovum caldicuralii TaxID=438856 RepID=A0AAU9BPS2_9GAMM|nr:undecaprenyldiphospho-muramoylpentapeptide beta-N-acetylglucosaminyltransferase [Methylomarinovum caldicuralii]BCX80718.1 UDP-N-acetylglucosamine--N-acetylmuramyl-(pentapeptide) pyrophosphoryl-undecaprenol N-acetylglucosamine transferase [Methylomarinovum caldicuralii]